MGITGILRTSVRFINLHRPMQTTSLLLLWVMGKIKGLQRGYAVSYCKTVKDCIALAYTDTCLPICYALFFIESFYTSQRIKESSPRLYRILLDRIHPACTLRNPNCDLLYQR